MAHEPGHQQAPAATPAPIFTQEDLDEFKRLGIRLDALDEKEEQERVKELAKAVREAEELSVERFEDAYERQVLRPLREVMEGLWPADSEQRDFAEEMLDRASADDFRQRALEREHRLPKGSLDR